MTAFKILVAEDNPDQRHEIGTYLRRHGFAVVCVEDGYQAVEFALREEPDLLLLDVKMPAGDGFSVHERVARHPKVAVSPVIYMTDDPTREIEIVAEEDGAFALLHKPFELEKMLSLINDALAPADDAVSKAA